MESQHGLPSTRSCTIHHVIRHEMSIDKSNKYIISHEMPNTKFTYTANNTTLPNELINYSIRSSIKYNFFDRIAGKASWH